MVPLLTKIHTRRSIIKIGKQIYERGFIVATDGNISVRLDSHRILITKSRVCKGKLNFNDIITYDYQKVSPPENTSSEIYLHLKAYNLRQDINAIIHSHPPYTVALTLAGKDLIESQLPEVIMTLGKVPTAKFAAPSSPEGAEVISELIKEYDAIILDRHGVITVGINLNEAYYKLEQLEFAARVTLIALSIGDIKKLTPEELDKIDKSIKYNRDRKVSLKTP